MSLPLGGRFDLDPTYSRQQGCTGLWWKPCHSTHTKGLNADIPFSGLSNRQLFYDIARANRGDPYEEGSHYHLRFTY